MSTPRSFKLLCIYVFFEYVRPQSLYPMLDGPPWAMLSLLAAILGFLVEGRRPNLPKLIAVPLVAYIALMLFSSVMAYAPGESIKDLKLVANWVFLIVLTAGLASSERRWFLFLIMYLLFCLKMSQHGFISWALRGFSFTSWGVTGGPNWFQNSGEFALQMSMFVPISVYFILAVRRHLAKWKTLALLFLPISAVGSIVASSSRGGLVALVVVAFIAAIRSRYRARAIVALCVGLPLLWLTVPDEFKARFDTAGTDATSVLRMRYWKRGMELAGKHPVLGVGPGSWVPYYRDHFIVPGDTLNRYDGRGQVVVQPAHNSFVEVASQLGYVGLGLYLTLIASCLMVSHQTRKSAKRLGDRGQFIMLCTRGLDDGVIAFCIAGFFMSVAYFPFIWMQMALICGLHAAARNALREQASSAGANSLLPANGVSQTGTGHAGRRGGRAGAGSFGLRPMPS